MWLESWRKIELWSMKGSNQFRSCKRILKNSWNLWESRPNRIKSTNSSKSTITFLPSTSMSKKYRNSPISTTSIKRSNNTKSVSATNSSRNIDKTSNRSFCMKTDDMKWAELSHESKSRTFTKRWKRW